jgi:hypothetical protein
VFAALVELESRADNKIADSARDQHLACAGEGTDAGRRFKVCGGWVGGEVGPDGFIDKTQHFSRWNVAPHVLPALGNGSGGGTSRAVGRVAIGVQDGNAVTPGGS